MASETSLSFGGIAVRFALIVRYAGEDVPRFDCLLIDCQLGFEQSRHHSVCSFMSLLHSVQHLAYAAAFASRIKLQEPWPTKHLEDLKPHNGKPTQSFVSIQTEHIHTVF
jgi:hypothetical protein